MVIPAAMNGPSTRKQSRQQGLVLEQWLKEHCYNMYPTKTAKEELAALTYMSYHQVSRWFANRRRKMKLATSNMHHVSATTPPLSISPASTEPAASPSTEDCIKHTGFTTAEPLLVKQTALEVQQVMLALAGHLQPPQQQPKPPSNLQHDATAAWQQQLLALQRQQLEQQQQQLNLWHAGLITQVHSPTARRPNVLQQCVPEHPLQRMPPTMLTPPSTAGLPVPDPQTHFETSLAAAMQASPLSVLTPPYSSPEPPRRDDDLDAKERIAIAVLCDLAKQRARQ